MNAGHSMRYEPINSNASPWCKLHFSVSEAVISIPMAARVRPFEKWKDSSYHRSPCCRWQSRQHPELPRLQHGLHSSDAFIRWVSNCFSGSTRQYPFQSININTQFISQKACKHFQSQAKSFLTVTSFPRTHNPTNCCSLNKVQQVGDSNPYITASRRNSKSLFHFVFYYLKAYLASFNFMFWNEFFVCVSLLFDWIQMVFIQFFNQQLPFYYLRMVWQEPYLSY